MLTYKLARHLNICNCLNNENYKASPLVSRLDSEIIFRLKWKVVGSPRSVASELAMLEAPHAASSPSSVLTFRSP